MFSTFCWLYFGLLKTTNNLYVDTKLEGNRVINLEHVPTNNFQMRVQLDCMEAGEPADNIDYVNLYYDGEKIPIRINVEWILFTGTTIFLNNKVYRTMEDLKIQPKDCEFYMDYENILLMLNNSSNNEFKVTNEKSSVTIGKGDLITCSNIYKNNIKINVLNGKIIIDQMFWRDDFYFPYTQKKSNEELFRFDNAVNYDTLHGDTNSLICLNVLELEEWYKNKHESHFYSTKCVSYRHFNLIKLLHDVTCLEYTQERTNRLINYLENSVLEKWTDENQKIMEIFDQIYSNEQKGGIVIKNEFKEDNEIEFLNYLEDSMVYEYNFNNLTPEMKYQYLMRTFYFEQLYKETLTRNKQLFNDGFASSLTQLFYPKEFLEKNYTINPFETKLFLENIDMFFDKNVSSSILEANTKFIKHFQIYLQSVREDQILKNIKTEIDKKYKEFKKYVGDNSIRIKKEEIEKEIKRLSDIIKNYIDNETYQGIIFANIQMECNQTLDKIQEHNFIHEQHQIDFKAFEGIFETLKKEQAARKKKYDEDVEKEETEKETESIQKEMNLIYKEISKFDNMSNKLLFKEDVKEILTWYNKLKEFHKTLKKHKSNSINVEDFYIQACEDNIQKIKNYAEYSSEKLAVALGLKFQSGKKDKTESKHGSDKKSSDAETKHKDRLSTSAIALIVISVVGFIIIVGGVSFLVYKTRKNQTTIESIIIEV